METTTGSRIHGLFPILKILDGTKDLIPWPLLHWVILGSYSGCNGKETGNYRDYRVYIGVITMILEYDRIMQDFNINHIIIY